MTSGLRTLAKSKWLGLIKVAMSMWYVIEFLCFQFCRTVEKSHCHICIWIIVAIIMLRIRAQGIVVSYQTEWMIHLMGQFSISLSVLPPQSHTQSSLFSTFVQQPTFPTPLLPLVFIYFVESYVFRQLKASATIYSFSCSLSLTIVIISL